ncbi:VOC family protein [Nocardioides albidus]|uniref:VOC family protein n=2 Tax=Nocardioides albidus TaxID=1517589 RepID=A0A5C4WJR5_9ACTN|nr:VOC family protein [Nocardioides albidus]
MTIASGHIQPCLWFDDRLEEAARFYTAIFPNSSIAHLGPLAGEFILDGLTFRGVNGGPDLPFHGSAFAINCRDQSEVDYYWDSLADGGEESVCGWLTDRFGLSWQVVPARLHELLTDPSPARATAASRALLGMRRIVVADLEAAADAAGPGVASR